MKTSKKLLMGIILVLTLMLCLAFGASAEEESGKCGDDVYWSLDSIRGELTITGTGGTWDLENWDYDYPRFYRKNIVSVYIEDGITSIAKNLFSECYKMKSIRLPSTLRSIGEWAFNECNRLEHVEIPIGVNYLGEGCFSTSAKLTRLIIPYTVTEIDGCIVSEYTPYTEILYMGTESQWKSVHTYGLNSYYEKNVYFNCCKTHNNTNEYPAQLSTCTEIGYTAGVYCKDCGYWIDGHDFIKPTRHIDENSDSICDVCNEFASDLIVGKDTVAICNDDNDALTFIPAISGKYSIDSTTNETYMCDTVAGEWLEDENFSIYEVELIAGRVYKVYAGYDDAYYKRAYLTPIYLGPYEDIIDPSVPAEPDEPTAEPDVPDNPDAPECSHLCHQSGFMGFIWKIVQFFWKLFKINPVCECGVAHY